MRLGLRGASWEMKPSGKSLYHRGVCWQGWAFVFSATVGIGCSASFPRQEPLVFSHPQLPAHLPSGLVTHEVLPKETLWAIGKRYHISAEAILRANHLTDATKIPVGLILIIPRPEVPRLVPIYPSRGQWTHIVIHHSATVYGNASLLDRAHRKRGFSNGLGYHFVINNGTSGRKDGQIEIGHRWKRQQAGAHCNAGGMNTHGIGICLVGDFTNHTISQAQMESLIGLVHQLSVAYHIPPARVIRHRDVRGKITACPGDRFPWTEFKRRFLWHLSQPSSDGTF